MPGWWGLGLLFALYALVRLSMFIVGRIAKCIGYGIASLTGQRHRHPLKKELEDDSRSWVEKKEREQAGTRPLEDPAMARWRESIEQRERDEIEARRHAYSDSADRGRVRHEGAMIRSSEYIEVVRVDAADAPVWFAYLEQLGIPRENLRGRPRGGVPASAGK